MKSRRTFSRDDKVAAVKKVVEQGLPFAQVARDLGIRDTLIHNWKKTFEADGTLQAEVSESPLGRGGAEASTRRKSSAQNGA